LSERSSVDSQFQGEDIPGKNDWHHRGGNVHYLSDAELSKHELTIRGGKLYDATGAPFDTSRATTWAGRNAAIYVVHQDGKIYASTYQDVGRFHHSSLGQGQPVAGAGEIKVKDGVLQSINRQSGHYLPTPAQLEQVVRHLRKQGVDFTSAIVESELE
jgi:hypothetical protein